MEGRMKILMTTDTVGGVWTYSISLCKALQAYGLSIHLAAMGGLTSKNQKQQVLKLPHVKLYESTYKLEWMENPWEDVAKAQQWLHSLYVGIQPDLIHLNNFAKINPNWNCSIINVYHSCVATWWQAVKKTSLPETWQAYLQLVRETITASDRVVAPTRAMLLQALETHNISKPTQVIYNASEVKSSSEVKKEKFIFSLGRIWDEAKNLQLLAAIAKELPWPVYIAGNTINPDNGTAVQLKNVKLLGQLSTKEVQNWMQRAAVFVSPTKYEPFGLGILEAARAKCALVISKLDSLQEIWENNALYFNPGKQKELLLQLCELIQNEEKRKLIAEKAQKHSENYSITRKGKAYEHLYRKLIHKQKLENI